MIGGVGSWAAEALARSGVAGLVLIDLDHVAESNINRQVQALGSTLGMAKAEALRRRVADIGASQVTHEWCVALASLHREPYAQYCLRHISQSAQQTGPAVALPDWIALLEQLAVRETAAAGSIHVMTIHKAKGLGFDVVFLVVCPLAFEFVLEE